MSINKQQIIEKGAQPIFTSSNQDKNNLLSFKDWKASYQGIVPNQEYKQYNDYLINWYKSKSSEVTDNKVILRLNYLNLLKQLQLFLTQEETENWYNNVNIENDKELLLAIPYFAKKLKDIAYYYLKLRDKVKNTRIQYNQLGSNNNITNEIRQLILSNYTQNKETIQLPSFLYKEIPALTAIKDTINVQIEELYDKQVYFDLSPTLPVSAYFDTDGDDLQDFLTSKNLSLSSIEWLYKLGVHSLSTVEDLDPEVTNNFAQKYLGQNKLVSTIPVISTSKEFFNISINPGNNFFFWPGSTYLTKALTFPRYQPISIQNEELLTVATAATSIEGADTVFTKTPRGIEGAWLYDEKYVYNNATMRAIISPSIKTVFRFPYPGFGTLAENIGWTGYNFETDPRFYFLDDTSKQTIESLYWSAATDLTSVKSIFINDTTLVESKAFAHKSYQHADKIRIWPTPPTYSQNSYSGEVK